MLHSRKERQHPHCPTGYGVGVPDLIWQAPSSQKERTYVRATRAPICCTAHSRSQISSSLGRATSIELLALASILARFGVLMPMNRYSRSCAPAMSKWCVSKRERILSLGAPPDAAVQLHAQ